MPHTVRSLFVIIVLTFCFNTLAHAQPRAGKYIHASIGLGITAPLEEVEINGSGFYAQGEYVLAFNKWFGVRPYAGILLTSPSTNIFENEMPEYKATTKAFMFGGKVRIAAPIPYVAPFIEAGFGASVGAFVTHTPQTDIEKNGVIMHIPVTIGLAIGRSHNYEFAFTYYYHNSVEQFGGAAAFGMAFPLD